MIKLYINYLNEVYSFSSVIYLTRNLLYDLSTPWYNCSNMNPQSLYRYRHFDMGSCHIRLHLWN